MNKTIICIIALVCVASATMTETEAMASIERMEKSRYGKTILDTIALQLSVQDSADDLILMLRETEQKMFDEQKKDDQTQMDLQNQCYADINRLTAEIKAAEKRLKEVNAEIEEKTEIRDNKVAERQDLEQFKALLIARLEELLVKKGVREEMWEIQKKEHDHATMVIQNAKQILENVWGDSFLQKSSHAQVFAQVATHFNESKKHQYTRKSWNTIFSLMAQITTFLGPQAENSAIKEIFGLMDKLLDEIAASREVERHSFELWMGEYEKNRAGVQKLLDETQASIDQLTAEINALTKRINMLKDEKQDLEERIAAKTTEREEITVMCDDEAAAYSTRRQARNDEMEVVSDAIALLTSKLRTLKKYVSKKTEGLEKPTL